MRNDTTDRLPARISTVALAVLVWGLGAAMAPTPGHAELAPSLPAMEGESLLHLGLGYTTAAQASPRSGPGIRAGWLYQSGAIGIDFTASFSALGPSLRDVDDKTGQRGGVALTFRWYVRPDNTGSPFVGAGLGYSLQHVPDDVGYNSGSGWAGRVGAGYEMLRHSDIRFTLGADVELPFYESDSEVLVIDATDRSLVQPTWVPSVLTHMTVAWD